ncbi:MAG: energy transducer TonB, partial [Alistipes sp.]|nr:energy transducer TonB [Alistipes sp.]
YPQEAMNRGIEGRVVLSFIIECDGSMGPVNVMQSPDRLLTDEALRILGTVPAGSWTPGMQNGQAVRVRYIIPVDFQIIPAQEKAQDKNEPFLLTQTMPKFQGGDLSSFRAWVQGHLSYPEEAKKHGIQGRIVVTFIIECDGSMGPVDVLASPDRLLTDEALRVLGTVPAGAWSPGRDKSGEAVRIKYTMPVDFRLDPAEAPTTSKNE